MVHFIIRQSTLVFESLRHECVHLPSKSLVITSTNDAAHSGREEDLQLLIMGYAGPPFRGNPLTTCYPVFRQMAACRGKCSHVPINHQQSHTSRFIVASEAAVQ